MSASRKVKKIKVVRDPEKEKVFRSLSEELAQKGYTVRREKLKQGFGWKVVSGSCQAMGQRMIFVDQRLPQDDQITFLRSQLQTLENPIEQQPEAAAALPA